MDRYKLGFLHNGLWQFNETQRQNEEEAKVQEGLKIKREIQRNMELDNEKAEAKRRAGLEMMKFMVEENKKNGEEKEKVNPPNFPCDPNCVDESHRHAPTCHPFFI